MTKQKSKPKGRPSKHGLANDVTLVVLPVPAIKGVSKETRITQSFLKSVLRYSKKSGEFKWLIRPSNNTRRGNIAGVITNSGYIAIVIGGIAFLAHRLAWLYVHGEFPDGFLDHINRVKNDNRISNLRKATNNENLCNTKLSTRNTSGFRGVSFVPKENKWVARIKFNGVDRSLGQHLTRESAYLAYQEASRIMHGEFRNKELVK